MEISQKIADSYVTTNKKMKKMTIDEAKSYLEVENMGISTTCKHFKANVKAMEIMEKYQKILEIFDRYDKGELTHNMFGLLVGEVLEDGNDN